MIDALGHRARRMAGIHGVGNIPRFITAAHTSMEYSIAAY